MAEILRRMGDYVKPVAKSIGVGVGLGIGGVALLATRSHRELTHKSVKLHHSIQQAIDLEQRSMGMDSTIWAAVHRIHHQMPDVSLFSFYKIARAVNWLEQNPNHGYDVEIPQDFKFLDPYVDSFSFEDVMKIGNLADQEIQKRLGDEYKLPESYSKEELEELLNPKEPQYWYPETEREPGDYSQEEIARILLTDPHSPSLHAPRNEHLNGVQEVLKHNVRDYKRAGNLFKVRPDLKEKDLQRQDDEANKGATKDVVYGFVISAAIALLLRGRFKPKDFAIAAAAGSAANGVKMGTTVIGGNIVNSIGHGVRPTISDLLQAVFAKDYKIRPNPDGSVSTDTANAGALARCLNWLVFDENEQNRHHLEPGKIAYTIKKGIGAILDAPFGSVTSYLANNRHVPFINPGEGFKLEEGERRPDIQHEAVDIVWENRVAQMKSNAMV